MSIVGGCRSVDQIEAGVSFDAFGGHGVDVTFSEDEVVVASHLDLVAVFGVEQHLVADFDAADVRPAATTSAQASRLLTWAVAGIRMSCRGRALALVGCGICTRMRSASILIGCLFSTCGALASPDPTLRR